MTKHLRDVHPDQFTAYLEAKNQVKKDKLDKMKADRELEQQIEASQEEMDEMEGVPSQLRKRPVTTPITKYYKPTKSSKYLPDSDFQRRAELDIAIYFATGNLSFQHISSKAFRRFMLARDPKVTVKSRSSLVKTSIPLLERNLREAQDRLLEEHMPGVPGAGFTSDMWSSKGQHSYLSLTMHFIDKKWRLHNLLIACRHIEEPSHTAALIGENLEDMLSEVKLPESVNIAFTTDGASAMVKSMTHSPMVHEHLVCICHIISNCLQEAFAEETIAPAITKLKALAGATHKSPKRIAALRKACKDLNSELIIFHVYNLNRS
jgi:hypothetical protein